MTDLTWTITVDQDGEARAIGDVTDTTAGAMNWKAIDVVPAAQPWRGLDTTVSVKGAAPHAEDPHETTTVLYGIPRVGDELEVWLGGHNGQAWIKVLSVFWPTYPDYHGNITPWIWLERPEDYSDGEWADVFAALKEKRKP